MTTDLERELTALLREKAEEAPQPHSLDQPTVIKIRRRRIVTVAGGLSSAAAVVLLLALGARALIADPVPVPPATQDPAPSSSSPTPTASATPSPSVSPSPSESAIAIQPAVWPDPITEIPAPAPNPEKPSPGGDYVDCQDPCVQNDTEIDGEVVDIAVYPVTGPWVLTLKDIQAIDLNTVVERRALPLEAGSTPTAIAAVPGHLFVTAGQQLIRIRTGNLTAHEIESFVPRAGWTLRDIDGDDGGLWITYVGPDGETGVMYTDYAGGVNATFEIPGAHGVAVADSFVWVSGTRALYQIDQTQQRLIAAFSTGDEPAGEVVARGRREIWTHLGGLVSQVDARTGRVMARYALDGAIGIADGRVWVATPAERALYRIDPNEQRVDDALSVGRAASIVGGSGNDLWTVEPGRTSQVLEITP